MPAVQNLLKAIKVLRVQNAAAAGTSTLAGSTVDLQGYDGVLFVYGVGTLTSTQVTKLKASVGADSGGSDKTDLAGSGTPAVGMLDADSNKLLVLDVYRPQPGTTSTTTAPTGTSPSPGYGGGKVPFRYVTPQLVRGTANAVVDFGIAILYQGMKSPLATQDTTVSAVNMLIEAATGTA